MSNVLLPVALLRPGCRAAIRTGPASTSQHFSALSGTILRQLSSSGCSSDRISRPSVLSLLQPGHSRIQSRSFSSSLHPRASVSKPPRAVPSAIQTPKQKRQVRIGPLPCGEVSPQTIESIFGRGISPADGNGALRILHHRRVSGSLADYGVGNLNSKFRNMTPELAMRGLVWLRQSFPVDEARAAEEWAEKEANRIAYELWLQEEDGGKRVADPARVWRDMAEGEKAERVYQTGLLHHGPSVLEQSIKEKRRKRLEEAARRAEEKEEKERKEAELIASGEYVRSPGGTMLIKPGETTYRNIMGQEQIDERKKWSDYYAKLSQTPFKSEEEMINAQTTFQRIWPTTIFVAVVGLCSWLYASTYTAPAEDYRLFPSLSPSIATCGTILATNLLIMLLWRHKPLWPFMSKYFVNVVGYPHFPAALLNTFSHVKPDHLFANMLWLMTVGVLCHDLVGRGAFLGTYFTAGAVGSLFTLLHSNLGFGTMTVYSLGASGAMYGVTTLFLLLTEQESIKMPFIKDWEVAFWPKMLWLAMCVMELRGLRKMKTLYDHPSHLGGIVAGLGVAGWIRWREGRLSWDDVFGLGEKKGDGKAGSIDVVGLLKEEVKEVGSVVDGVGKGGGDRK